MLGTVPPLTAATLLFRTEGQLTDLPYALTSVSLFLDSSVELPSVHAGLSRWKNSEIFVKNTDLGSPWTLRKYIRGQLEMVKWLARNRSERYTAETMKVAARNGHLHVVKWLHEDGARCTRKAMNGAAKEGHLDVVKWLHHFRTEGCTADAMDAAAGRGKLTVVKWLHGNRSEGCTSAAMDTAAGGNHLEVVKWLHNHRTEGCTTAAMDEAAKAENFDMVLLLHSHRHESCSQLAFRNTDDELTVDIYRWLADH